MVYSRDKKFSATGFANFLRENKKITYVGKLECAVEGGYITSFPDFNPNIMDQGETVRETINFARRGLVSYLTTSLFNGDDIPQPRYRMRTDLKRTKTFKVNVYSRDLKDVLDI